MFRLQPTGNLCLRAKYLVRVGYLSFYLPLVNTASARRAAGTVCPPSARHTKKSNKKSTPKQLQAKQNRTRRAHVYTELRGWVGSTKAPPYNIALWNSSRVIARYQEGSGGVLSGTLPVFTVVQCRAPQKTCSCDNQEHVPDSMGRFQSLQITADEGGSAEPTRDKNIIGMYRRRGSNPPLLCDPGWVV